MDQQKGRRHKKRAREMGNKNTKSDKVGTGQEVSLESETALSNRPDCGSVTAVDFGSVDAGDFGSVTAGALLALDTVAPSPKGTVGLAGSPVSFPIRSPLLLLVCPSTGVRLCSISFAALPLNIQRQTPLVYPGGPPYQKPSSGSL
ncbi:hypothetical protein EXN66_Car004542 [Channa argus]|uniref:Uncharacterized protein n=1 Tax=Channa argus TaxID=215402 RepID=A0A6G1PEY7_CHAAH|nr:hypothetical protein EXN66_Car004542 [Channa argus]